MKKKPSTAIRWTDRRWFKRVGHVRRSIATSWYTRTRNYHRTQSTLGPTCSDDVVNTTCLSTSRRESVFGTGIEKSNIHSETIARGRVQCDTGRRWHDHVGARGDSGIFPGRRCRRVQRFTRAFPGFLEELPRLRFINLSHGNALQNSFPTAFLLGDDWLVSRL